MSDTELQRDDDMVQAFADQGAEADGIGVQTADDALGTPTNETPEAVLNQRVAALEDQLLRTRAEQQNVVRRLGLERQDAVRFANAELIRAIIPVIDDLDRAIEAASGSGGKGADKALLDGVKLVRDNFIKALCSQGLEVIEANGKPFDPHVHEAMMQQPSDEHEPGTVIQELAKGYRLRERTLRPAKVIVCKKP